MNGSAYPNLRPGSLPRGQTRPYAQALADDVIDHRVRQLVSALNVDGVCSTFASCEGHGLLRCHVPPYVGLEAETTFVGALSVLLEQDAACDEPSLRYNWTVSGIFDRQGKLRFCLAPGEHVRGWWSIARRNLDQDFGTLSQAIQLLTQRWQADPTGLECKRQHHHDERDDQHSPKLTPLVRSNKTEWIGTSAIGAGLCAGADGRSAFLARMKRHAFLLSKLGIVSVRSFR